jgi:hypothetical protein
MGIMMPLRNIPDHVAYGNFAARGTLKIKGKIGGRRQPLKALLRDGVPNRLKVPLEFVCAGHGVFPQSAVNSS